jgi:large subunit ribosomal protein L25
VSGDSVGVLAGGKLSIKRRTLKVKGLAENLPEDLAIDITNLKIHEGIKVGDLTYDKIELLDPKKSMVLTIATSRVAQKTDEEVLAEETAAAEAAAATAAATASPEASAAEKK